MKNDYDLIIIGGGVMGLMTAYFATKECKNILILEKESILNPLGASSGFTRSIRNDYIDPFYSQCAFDARLVWKKIEKATGQTFITDCGCLNLCNTSVTKNKAASYAQKSFQTLGLLGRKRKKFDKQTLRKQFPQFSADFGTLDEEAGFINVRLVMQTLIENIKNQGVFIKEKVVVSKIKEFDQSIQLRVNKKSITTRKLVITAGSWSNSVLKNIVGLNWTVPLSFDKPQECIYLIPPKKMRSWYLPKKFPVFAYLDVGIYGHPLTYFTKGIKIGYFQPAGFKSSATKIKSVKDFVRFCLPSLQNATCIPITDADQCRYDLTPDGDFIIGSIPNYKNISIACGWNGTGFKFAPLVGTWLKELVLDQKSTIPSRFSPNRFK